MVFFTNTVCCPRLIMERRAVVIRVDKDQQMENILLVVILLQMMSVPESEEDLALAVNPMTLALTGHVMVTLAEAGNVMVTHAGAGHLKVTHTCVIRTCVSVSMQHAH